MTKGSLRLIALAVLDKEAAAQFYEEAFGFKRMSQSVVATRFSDGVMNLTLPQFRNQEDAGDERAPNFEGLHHFGIWVDDLEETKRAIEAHGAIIARRRAATRLPMQSTSFEIRTEPSSTSVRMGGTALSAEQKILCIASRFRRPANSHDPTLPSSSRREGVRSGCPALSPPKTKMGYRWRTTSTDRCGAFSGRWQRRYRALGQIRPMFSMTVFIIRVSDNNRFVELRKEVFEESFSTPTLVTLAASPRILD
jgi:methylmalonyl-CoA/ethylmalonyl-CoA epimerase